MTFPGASSKQVQTKVIDNKLKIIDDVPSSAVEMAVKEKVFDQKDILALYLFHAYFPQFLKKVQRQERIVEEVKLVLKPAYNARKINKEAYKEILRKTVPKVWATSVVFLAFFLKILISGVPQQIWGDQPIQDWEAGAGVYQEAPASHQKEIETEEEFLKRIISPTAPLWYQFTVHIFSMRKNHEISY